MSAGIKGLFNPELVAALESMIAGISDDECRRALARGLNRMDSKQLQMVLGFVAGVLGGLDGDEIAATMRALLSDDAHQRRRPS